MRRPGIEPGPALWVIDYRLGHYPRPHCEFGTMWEIPAMHIWNYTIWSHLFSLSILFIHYLYPFYPFFYLFLIIYFLYLFSSIFFSLFVLSILYIHSLFLLSLSILSVASLYSFSLSIPYIYSRISILSIYSPWSLFLSFFALTYHVL